MRALTMLWNVEAGPLVCRWADSKEREDPSEVLIRLKQSEALANAGHEEPVPLPARLDWHLLCDFRQPPFPASRPHSG
jgi:hypothetical protein